VRPATLIVALRDAPVVAATLNVTRPVPVPEAPLVTSIQPAFDTAVQEHVLADAVTSIVPGPPAAGTVRPPG
jgi:hypothetical protein